MIQLRIIRARFAGGGVETFSERRLDRDITVESTAKLFKDLEKYVDKIPEHDRYNVYYTAGSTNGGDKRAWHGQDVIPFDIDHTVDEQGKSDDQKLILVIFKALGADPEKSVVVRSGNGLQILIQPERPILTEDFFRINKGAYDDLCEKIKAALVAEGLKGDPDETSFAPNRILRLPGTENRKPGKEPRQATLLKRNLEPQPFSICPPAAGISVKKEPWSADSKEQISEAMLRNFRIDTGSVEEGCSFLSYAKNGANELSEAQWYAMLSVVSRLDDGRAKAHEYSKGDIRYTEAATDKKIDQALAASGPRTCANIETLWDGCTSCPNYKKVTSPVSIKSDDFIATEHTGFHLLSEKGALRPQITDLRKFFERENPYRVHNKSGVVFVFEKDRYETWSDSQLRGFAQKHFNPEPTESTAQEFKQSVTRSNLISTEWFTESIRHKINFKNGVYDIKEKALHPHDPRWGFLYCLPFDFDADAECPTFDKFISDFTCGDKELEAILCEFIGYAICDRDYWLQKALLLIGKGSNGKSSFFDIVTALVGEKNTSYLSLPALQSETSRSHLEGKILNIGDELPNYKTKDTEVFKLLFGGVTMTKKLYHDSTPMRNTTKFIFGGNEIPVSDDTSKGFIRRLTIVPCRANFDIGSNADTKIVAKMKLELPGIFNKVMAAYALMQKRGDFTESHVVTKALVDYTLEIDHVGRWVKENLEVSSNFSEGDFTTITSIFDRYAAEAIRGHERPIPKNVFVKKLKNHIPGWDTRHGRKVIGSEKPYILKGVKFSLDQEPENKAMF